MSAIDPDLMLHLHRSRCIDAFARAETAITTILIGHAKPVSSETLGQKLAVLRALPAGPQYSKAARAMMQAALDEFEPLTSIRNDVVHGELMLLTSQGRSYAGFINARQQGDICKQARLISADSFVALEKAVSATTAKIEAAAKPHSLKTAKPASQEVPSA